MGKKSKRPPSSIDPGDPGSLADELRKLPLQWSIVLPVRAALRILPTSQLASKDSLPALRASAVARFSAKYPNSSLDNFADHALNAYHSVEASDDGTATALGCAHIAASIAFARKGAGASSIFDMASETIEAAGRVAAGEGYLSEFLSATVSDLEFLKETADYFKLMDSPLWPNNEIPLRAIDHWKMWKAKLISNGPHWWIWSEWIDNRIEGRSTNEFDDVAFTDLPGALPWNDSEATSIAIQVRLAKPDSENLEPIDGLHSPITITQRADGRIGIEAGPFSLPTLPPAVSQADHQRSLATCRSRAVHLVKLASSPNFQGRSEYAQILGDYLEWLPDENGSGNMLLADGEARILNKLFAAEETILPTVFASKLSVFLEDNIALRSFYPEIERHYHSVNTGRLVTPLSRDAVEAIHRVIISQTPTVFDETLSPAIDEAAKPVPNFSFPRQEELSAPDPNRPKPPHDPIADADPQKSRNFTIASAYNRIWALIVRSKDAAQAIEGWQKTYHLLKPHMAHVLDFLRSLGEGGGPGGPTLPPTIGA